jgi:folate-binding protein YgfZ
LCEPWLAPAECVADVKAWDALEVASGVARVEARTKDAFVPQMINWDLVGGVSFSKGCYPGQEVVARSQYRGTIKRRLVRVSIPLASSVAIGESIFDTADPDQPAGQIANAAHDSGVWTALVEVKLAALTDGATQGDAHAAAHSAARLRLGSSEGLPMALEPLPYVISAPT